MELWYVAYIFTSQTCEWHYIVIPLCCVDKLTLWTLEPNEENKPF